MVCEWKCKEAAGIWKHMSSSHGGAPGFQCNVCPQLFHRLHQLILHKHDVHGVIEAKHKRWVSQYKQREEKDALLHQADLE